MARIADQFDVVVGVDTHTDSHTAVLRLAARIERPSTVAEREPLVCSAAEVTCHHDGTWTITAYLENHETEADVSFDPTWTTIGTSRPFGITVAGQLSATGDGRVSKIGLRILGVHPAGDSTGSVTTLHSPIPRSGARSSKPPASST